MVIDFYGYKTTGLRMSPEQYDDFLQSYREDKDISFSEKILSLIISRSF